jgi:xylobiose transport system permease protein
VILRGLDGGGREIYGRPPCFASLVKFRHRLEGESRDQSNSASAVRLVARDRPADGAFALPLSIVVLTSSLRDVPQELYEAITIDGAGTVRTLFSLVLPLSRSGLATIGIYTALQAWNGFLFPLVLTQDPAVRVLTLGLWDFQGQYGTNVPLVTAAVTLSLLPLLVVYLLGRRFLLAGLTAGAGK